MRAIVLQLQNLQLKMTMIKLVDRKTITTLSSKINKNRSQDKMRMKVNLKTKSMAKMVGMTMKLTMRSIAATMSSNSQLRNKTVQW